MSQYFNVPVPEGAAAQPTVRGRQTPGMAIASFILGVLSLPLVACFGPILAVLAILFGLIASVKIKRDPARFKGQWLAMGGLVTGVIGLIAFTVFTLRIWGMREELLAAQDLPSSASALQVAEDNIRSKRGDEVAFGNSEPARELAASMAEQMKTLREAGFSAGRTSGFSLSGGEFLTHCELGEDTCAFLVHVPQLRKFDDEAKVMLNDLAWLLAQSLLATTDFPEGGELAVGLKGALLYDDVRVGKHLKSWTEEDETPGLERRGVGNDGLGRFFPDPEPETDADPADPSPGDPSPADPEFPSAGNPVSESKPQPQIPRQP